MYSGSDMLLRERCTLLQRRIRAAAAMSTLPAAPSLAFSPFVHHHHHNNVNINNTSNSNITISSSNSNNSGAPSANSYVMDFAFHPLESLAPTERCMLYYCCGCVLLCWCLCFSVLSAPRSSLPPLSLLRFFPLLTFFRFFFFTLSSFPDDKIFMELKQLTGSYCNIGNNSNSHNSSNNNKRLVTSTSSNNSSSTNFPLSVDRQRKIAPLHNYVLLSGGSDPFVVEATHLVNQAMSRVVSFEKNIYYLGVWKEGREEEDREERGENRQEKRMRGRVQMLFPNLAFFCFSAQKKRLSLCV